MPESKSYQVIVGNIGAVYSGYSLREAHANFREYRLQSKGGPFGKSKGRAYRETVTLTEGADGDPIREYTPPIARTPPLTTLAKLIASLKRNISPDYHTEGDEPGDPPSMDVTVGWSDETGNWSYQTGDNSFTGGAYGYPHWAVVTIYKSRACKAREVAEDIKGQLLELAHG